MTGERGGQSGVKETAPSPPPARSADLADLIRISRAVGADPDLAQGAGGNTSVKSRDGKRLLVKTSGVLLADVGERGGWAEVDLAAVLAILERADLAALPAVPREAEVEQLLRAAVIRPAGARPSVETGLHALLERVAIHSHPAGLNAFLCSRRSREAFAEVLGGAAGEPLYVPYTDPGFTLAARVRREVEAYRARHGRLPRAVLLENHGLFVAAPDADACLALHGKVTEAGASWFGAGRVNPQAFDLVVEDAAGVENATLRGTLLAAGCAPALLRRDGSPVAQRFLGQPAAVDLVRHGALTPDQFVYCRTPPLVLEGEPAGWAAAARAYRERRGLDPRVVIRKAAGGTAGSVHYLAPDLTVLRAVGDVWRCAMATILRSPAAGEARFLTGEETSFLEIYAAAGKARAAGPLDLTGRIACVTGAGSGLGKGIARGIAGAGATVFALDINQGALSAAAADFPAGKFLPRAADVTSEESIAAAFRALEASLGGLDFLVNAAGIAPSHPLADFPLAAWRKALDINLTGYFLCAREAARLLLRQGAGGAIVNLTSKSGLEASKDNSAYNATKAGEIHLARGWALELGKAGIRVNCVAPGNVFKGSQIWNQEYIEACARKKGIRPEEVIPYYNSLSALGKEIEPEDVAGAVVFLLSDAARNITGQTLVVDGGQAMVR